jgi:hypothetical protein
MRRHDGERQRRIVGRKESSGETLTLTMTSIFSSFSSVPRVSRLNDPAF